MNRRLWILGVLLLGGFCLPALLAPWLAPHDPFGVDLARSLQPAGEAAWLGTDEQGADILSRLLYGARISLLVGLSAVTASALIGGLMGLIA